MKKLLFILLFSLISFVASALDYFWVGNGTTNNWANKFCWSSTSGGVGGAGITSPTYPDGTVNAIFDNNSMQNCVLDAGLNLNCFDLDCTGYAARITFNSSATLTISDKTKLSPTMQVLGTAGGNNYFILTATSSSFNSDTISIHDVSIRINDGASVNPLSNVTLLGTNAGFLMTGGTWDNTGDYNMHFAGVTINTDTGVTLIMGSSAGRWTIYGKDGDFGTYAWDINGAGSYSITVGGTTQIDFTNVSASTVTYSTTQSNLYYGDIVFNRATATGINQLIGDETFYHYIDSGTVAHSGYFYDGSLTTIVGGFDVSGSAGQLITLRANSTTFRIDNQTGADICVDYIDLINSQGLTDPFYAGCHSINGGGNSGTWAFTNCGVACPAATGTVQIMILH